MRKLIFILSLMLTGAALFGIGWLLGRRTTAKTASDLLRANSFNTTYSELTVSQTVMEELDSGRIDDAKQMLRSHQDGSILGLDLLLEPANLSARELAAVRDQVARDVPPVNMPDMANRLLGRVARHRAEHPWTDRRKATQQSDTEVQAKITAILKRATEAAK